MSDKERRAQKRKKDRNRIAQKMREEEFFKLRVEKPKVEYSRKEKYRIDYKKIDDVEEFFYNEED